MITGTIERIRAHLRTPGVTKKALAEKARLHPNTLQGIEEAGWNPSASTLIALEAQLPPPEDEAPPAQVAA
jgi:lambda repressor-like predicted transcriptional regulator